MELNQAIQLIRHPRFSPQKIETWADLGCGSGLFTQALSTLLISGSTVYAIDTDQKALNRVRSSSDISIEKIQADFVHDEIRLRKLNGILMANSLHFVKDKISLIKKLDKSFLATGIFLIIEYDMNAPNPWVPYPISFHSLKELFEPLGYASVQRITELPSRYNRANIYSALIER